MKIRTVRFTTEEDKIIETFLNENRIFDFSTLTKTAIFRFVENPEIILKAVKKENPSYKKRGADVTV